MKAYSTPRECMKQIQGSPALQKHLAKRKLLCIHYITKKDPPLPETILSIPIDITELIAIFTMQTEWKFHPKKNPTFPNLKISDDGLTADNLSLRKYQTCYFGEELTYGTKMTFTIFLNGTPGNVVKLGT